MRRGQAYLVGKHHAVPLAESEPGEGVLGAFWIDNDSLAVWLEEARDVGHDERYAAEVQGVARAQTRVGCGEAAAPLLGSEPVRSLGARGGVAQVARLRPELLEDG